MQSNVFGKKPTSTTVTQPPGGRSSISFGDDTTPQQTPPRSGILVRSGSTTYTPSKGSPFSANPEMPEPPRSSIQVKANNPSNTPSVESMFSTQPMPRTGRQNSLVNVPSANNPFYSDPNVPPPTVQPSYTPQANVPSAQNPFTADPNAPVAQVQGRAFAANQMSANSPFNGTVEPQAKYNYQPKANQQSEQSPFTAPAQLPLQQAPSSVKIQYSPGGKANINLFEAPAPPQPNTKEPTPTYGYSEQSIFNKNAPPVTPPPRRASQVNNMSPANIFSGQEVQAQPPPSRVFKANEPDKNSPWSQVAPPAATTDRDKANRQSIESPFATNTNAPPPGQGSTAPAKSVVRVQQAPGGNQSFNLFGDNQYEKRN